jgi:hypothetical protein
MPSHRDQSHFHGVARCVGIKDTALLDVRSDKDYGVIVELTVSKPLHRGQVAVTVQFDAELMEDFADAVIEAYNVVRGAQ